VDQEREEYMHAVTRTYSGKGAKELFDVLEHNKNDIERLARSIRGFVSFYLVRTSDGGFSVSVFQDKVGTDESVRLAKDWISKNAAHVAANPPVVMEGSAILLAK
jgi:heme-degrading monooxygenase HmoA